MLTIILFTLTRKGAFAATRKNCFCKKEKPIYASCKHTVWHKYHKVKELSVGKSENTVQS